QAMLNELVKQAERKAAGLIDPFQDERKRAITEHVADFESDLAARGNSPKHVKQTAHRIRKQFTGCGFKTLADVSASRLVQWLADERKADRMGIKTSNYYLAAAKEFCTWLVRDRRLPNSPLAHLTAINADTDVRRER